MADKGGDQLPAWLAGKLTQAQPPPDASRATRKALRDKRGGVVVQEHQLLTQELVFFGLETFVCDCLVRKQPGQPVPHRDIRTYKHDSERVNISASHNSPHVKKQMTTKPQTEKWRRE